MEEIGPGPSSADTIATQLSPAIHAIQPALVHPRTAFPLWSFAAARPLSDIRELSEPSLIASIRYDAKDHTLRQRHRGTHVLTRASDTSAAAPIVKQETPKMQKRPGVPQLNGSSSYSSTPESASPYSVPPSSVPKRSSSKKGTACPVASVKQGPSTDGEHTRLLQPLAQSGLAIPNRGPSRSPIKEAGLRLDAHTSQTAQRIPSRTYVRQPRSIDILESPHSRHPRVRLSLHVPDPMFVGGGSVEGHVKITVDDNEKLKHRRTISVGAISVDLLGYEDMADGRKAAFLALGTDLLDARHHLPLSMIQPFSELFEDSEFWPLKPSCTTLPFMISLPLKTGPPPFRSKSASIRFVLCTTALLREAGTEYRVRTSQEVQVLPTLDPETTLAFQVKPLTVSDEFCIPRTNGLEYVQLIAGLHRQVWISGSSIFVDVHIANKSRKMVRKLELTLERDVLCYKHAATATLQTSAEQARIFDTNERTIVARTLFKPGIVGWDGVDPQSSETRTCEIEVPRCHATIQCGKFFEVRFLLNTTVSISRCKPVAVQLPVELIHMTSLDVLPNAVAQVAVAFEEERAEAKRKLSRTERSIRRPRSQQRSHSPPVAATEPRRQASYTQGRAFAAPREQSLDRQRRQQAYVEEIRNIIDTSPRLHEVAGKPSCRGLIMKKLASGLTPGSTPPSDKKPAESLNVFGTMSHRTRPPEPILIKASLPLSSNIKRPPSPKVALADRSQDEEPPRSASSLAVRRLRSLGSMDCKMSINQASAFPIIQQQRRKPRSVTQQRPVPDSSQLILPQTLGLIESTTPKAIHDQSTHTDVRPRGDAAGEAIVAGQNSGVEMMLPLRGRLDQSRFHFKAIDRKRSVNGLRERGKHWWNSIVRAHHEGESSTGPKPDGGWI